MLGEEKVCKDRRYLVAERYCEEWKKETAEGMKWFNIAITKIQYPSLIMLQEIFPMWKLADYLPVTVIHTPLCGVAIY